MRQEFQRGQVWFYEDDRDKKEGSHVQHGSRPVIIVSNSAANKFSGALLAVPCTTRPKKNLPTHVLFVMDGKFNVAMAEQAGPVDVNNLVNLKYTLEPYLMEQVDEALKVAFGLKQIPYEDKVELTSNFEIVIPEKVFDEPVPEPVVEQVNKRKWNIQDKLQYVWDYKHEGIDFCIEEYNIKRSSAAVYYSQFRKYIEKLRSEEVKYDNQSRPRKAHS